MSDNSRINSGVTGLLIEAEDFESYGGWVLDSRFETQMGSPYLLAHGLGNLSAKFLFLMAMCRLGFTTSLDSMGVAIRFISVMMAGKHISVTDIAGSSTKYLGSGVAAAAAATLCNKHETTLCGLYEESLSELKDLVAELSSCDHDMNHSPPTRRYKPVPG